AAIHRVPALEKARELARSAPQALRAGLTARAEATQHECTRGITRNKKPRMLSHAGSELIRRRPTLPRSSPRSTIGSEGLDFRVRDGIGYDPFDFATEIFESAERGSGVFLH